MDLESVLIGEDNTVPRARYTSPDSPTSIRPPVVPRLAGGLP